MANIIVDKQDAITLITLNRPDQRNALTRAMRTEIGDLIRDFNADPEQVVAIVTGAGEQAFSAGADLKEMASEVENTDRIPISASPDIGGISDSEKPVIGAINGLAVAGGCEIALSCDIRIASTNAWFGLFEVKVGVIAGVGANILPRLVPMGTAMDMLLAAERLSAEDAFRLGLVQQLVAPGDLLDAAMKKAVAISRNSPTAVWGTKKIVKFWRDAMLAEQHRFYQAIANRVLLSGDVHEGPKAFAEKRPPKFSKNWPKP